MLVQDLRAKVKQEAKRLLEQGILLETYDPNKINVVMHQGKLRIELPCYNGTKSYTHILEIEL